MSNNLNIPRREEEITPDWLTAALREASVIQYTRVAGLTMRPVGVKEGFMSSLFKIDLDYSRSEASAPASVIAKLVTAESGALGDLQRENNRRETGFYQMAAGLPLPVPAVYYCQFDAQSGACVLLLQDLSGLRSVDFLAGCTVREAEAAVRALARVHVQWWDSPALAEAAWPSDFAAYPFAAYWAAYPAAYDELFPGRALPKSVLTLGQDMADSYALTMQRLEGSPATLIHRDCHVDNMLFGESGEGVTATVVDWQGAGRGLGVSDIAYVLISSLPPEERRAAEKRLVRLYHERLVAGGIAGYSFAACWSDYLFSAVAKLFITVLATVLVDNSTEHRRAWRTADLERLAAFVEDHGVGT